MQDIVEKLIRERKLEQFVRALQNGGAGPSNLNQGQGQARLEEPARIGRRLIINTISGDPHLADRSWKKMESYASSARHVDFECCSNSDDGSRPSNKER